VKSISSTLVAYARGREKALRANGEFDAHKAKAVNQIKIVAGYCARIHPQKQLVFVSTIEVPILELIPDDHIAYQKLRKEIFELLDRARA